MKSKIGLIMLVMLLASCNNREFLKRMQENEEGVHSPTTVAELESAISKYERRVEDIMIAQNRIANWYKMLGTRYVDSKMYVKALTAYTKALEYYPDNHNLYYETGLCASKIAKNFATLATEAEHDATYYYALAVKAYISALQLHYEALFVLAAAYYLNQDYDNAIRTYNTIVQNAKDKEVVAAAKKNILQIEMGQK